MFLYFLKLIHIYLFFRTIVEEKIDEDGLIHDLSPIDLLYMLSIMKIIKEYIVGEWQAGSRIVTSHIVYMSSSLCTCMHIIFIGMYWEDIADHVFEVSIWRERKKKSNLF